MVTGRSLRRNYHTSCNQTIKQTPWNQAPLYWPYGSAIFTTR